MSVATLPGSRIPGIEQARTYERARLRADLLAAVTVWELLVPQALANGAGRRVAAFAVSAPARTPPGVAG